MTIAADSREVFGRGFSRAIQDSSTPADRARRGASRVLKSHEIRRREGTQLGLKRFIIKS